MRNLAERGDDKLLRAAGVKSTEIGKLIKYIRTEQYET